MTEVERYHTTELIIFNKIEQNADFYIICTKFSFQINTPHLFLLENDRNLSICETDNAYSVFGKLRLIPVELSEHREKRGIY